MDNFVSTETFLERAPGRKPKKSRKQKPPQKECKPEKKTNKIWRLSGQGPKEKTKKIEK